MGRGHTGLHKYVADRLSVKPCIMVALKPAVSVNIIHVFLFYSLCTIITIQLVESGWSVILRAIFPMTAPAMTSLSVVSSSSSNECPKCDVTKKSGKHSCCARGGAWFKNCGDASDTQFDHTWAEGVKACLLYTSDAADE